MKTILIVAVHPDDETLGCGGTLLRHKAEGDSIHWLICTETNRENEFYETRKKEIVKVSEMYGFDGTHKLGLRTMQVDEYSMSELIMKISAVISQVKPDVIYLPFRADVHSDHRKIFEATYSCTKSFRYPFLRKLLMMETVSETEFAPSTVDNAFIPNVFVDISKYLERKLEIIRVFESEIEPHPFPRSLRNIKALATLRGATAACEYAESFVLLKEIQ